MNTTHNGAPIAAHDALDRAYDRARVHGAPRLLIVPSTPVLPPVDAVAVAFDAIENYDAGCKLQDAAQAFIDLYHEATGIK